MSSTTNLHLIIQTYYPPVTLLIEQPNSMESEQSNCCDVSSHNCTVQCTVHCTVQCTVQCTVRIVLKMMKPLNADKRMK